MPDVDKLFERADKYLQKQKFEAALETFQEIYKYEPGDEEVLLNLGDLCLKLNRNSEAVRYLAQLADDYVKRNEAPKAIATCRKMLKVAPQDLSILTKLAALLEKSQKTSEALEAYRAAYEIHRKAGAATQALDCLEHAVKLEPNNLAAQVELGELATRTNHPEIATPAFLKAAQLAREASQEERWAELAERAHQLNSTDEAASIAAAEVYLKKDRAPDAASLLEPIYAKRPDEVEILDLLSQAYLRTGSFAKAEPICWKLYQARPETVPQLLKVIEGFVHTGSVDKALASLGKIKAALFQQGKKTEFLQLAEKIYAVDESSLPVLEMLTALYDELNKEDGLRRSLARLFNLYLAGEDYQKAATTLERILDVDPYGQGHQDRLLNLEGHIDKVWYESISSRIIPSSATRPPSASATGTGAAAARKSEGLDDLIIEGEMYYQYQLTAKLNEVVQKINRLFPGAEQKNDRLRELYQAAGFTPVTPVAMPPSGAALPPAAEAPRTPPSAPAAQSFDELKKITEVTANIYRESTPQGVMQVAVNEIGRTLSASRCWGALGAPDRPPALIAEYCSPAASASDVPAAVKLYTLLMQQALAKPDGWLMEDVTQFPAVAPILPDILPLGIKSLLALPLMDRDQAVGLLLVEQCDRGRAWTPGESVLLTAITTQVVTAVNNTKLRRLVRSLAGSDEETGLLPRSSYLDCLLAEAARAKEQLVSLSVCLVEPDNPAGLVKAQGDAAVQKYFQQVSKALQSNLRQNDMAVRYNPWAIAVVFPDTALPQAGLAVEKLRRVIAQVKLDGKNPPNFCSAVCDVPLGPVFDAVDGVTEVVNRLDWALEQSHKESGKRVFLSKFEE
jgi:tetratricopeptide (TPR) repeat protein/GGDEF domain-containing protein